MMIEAKHSILAVNVHDMIRTVLAKYVLLTSNKPHTVTLLTSY